MTAIFQIPLIPWFIWITQCPTLMKSSAIIAVISYLTSSYRLTWTIVPYFLIESFLNYCFISDCSLLVSCMCTSFKLFLNCQGCWGLFWPLPVLVFSTYTFLQKNCIRDHGFNCFLYDDELKYLFQYPQIPSSFPYVYLHTRYFYLEVLHRF